MCVVCVSAVRGNKNSIFPFVAKCISNMNRRKNIKIQQIRSDSQWFIRSMKFAASQMESLSLSLDLFMPHFLSLHYMRIVPFVRVSACVVNFFPIKLLIAIVSQFYFSFSHSKLHTIDQITMPNANYIWSFCVYSILSSNVFI